jgi:hypothetical protein
MCLGVMKKFLVGLNGRGQQGSYPKTASHLLYSPEGEVVAWGWQARIKLADLRKNKQAEEYTFINNFKMELHKKEDMTVDGLCITRNGRKFLVVDIISDYLKELKKFALDKIQATKTQAVEENQIRWCLTVPAIWTDVDKDLMRRAAQKAGLIGESRDEQRRLVFAFEPEAAAIFCQLKEQIPALSGMLPGTRFMVVDCGGGTLDIVTYETVLVDGKVRLKGICPPTGSADGSTYVDHEFLQYLRQKLTHEVINRFLDEYPLEYLGLMDTWEGIKCNFNPQDNKITYFPLPIRLYKILDTEYRDILEHLTNEQDGEYENILLDRPTMESFFRPSLDALVSEMQEQFEKLNGQECDYIFLVGGFSNSPLLQQRVKQEFETRLRRKKVVIPPNLSAAIVEGSAYFGLNEGVTVGRTSLVTYGFERELPFDYKLDPESKQVQRKFFTGENCKERFSIIVRSGQYVGVNEVKTEITHADRLLQAEIPIRFYTTRKNEPRYIDESGVNFLGELKVNIKDIWEDAEDLKDVVKRGLEYLTKYAFKPENWQVEIKMYFGQTELKVEARDLRTGKILPVTFDFSYTYFPDEVGG